MIGGPTAFTSSFGFDDLYRPVSATDPTGSYSWSYDGDNNRASQTINGATASYTVDSANRLTSEGGAAVTTDANGNITADNTGKTYLWDARGRLTQVSQKGTLLASYTYATNGTRSSMTENGVTTNFLLDGTMCVSEIPAAGGTPTPTLFGPTGPLSRGGQWFSPDGSGSIAAVTDGNTGLQIAQNCYGVFGQMATTNPNSGDPLQYLGGMADQAAGADYLGGKGAWSSNLGQDLSGFTGGVLNCVGHAAVGTFTSLASYNALSPFVDPIVAVGHFVQSVRQKGLASAVLDPITDTLQQLGDFSSPEAAGNSLCNDTLAGLTVVGGVDTLVEGPCFPAGTPVTTPKGAKPIEKVRRGDTVLSADPATGKRSYQKVTRVFVHQASMLLKIETADGRSIEATPTHPFWVKGKGFVAAKRLARSDLLEDDHGRFGAVVKVTARRGQFTVYNFEVARTHTYFAGGFWVHNACDPADIALGHEAEAAFRRMLQVDEGVGLEPKPNGATEGPDAVWDQTGNNPGWNFAELKPDNRNGIYQGKNQVVGRFDEGYGPVGALYLWSLNLETGGFDFRLFGTFTE